MQTVKYLLFLRDDCYNFSYNGVPRMIYSLSTYHTHRHTLKATMFIQKNADMKAKYNINPKMQMYGLDNNKKSKGRELKKKR